MFYCDECRITNGYPSAILKSHGICEMCGKKASCHDCPSEYLNIEPEDKPNAVEIDS